MLQLKNIEFEDNGRKIAYDYTVSQKIKKYFDKDHQFYATYDIAVDSTPKSIAVIPFVCNMLPIAWFVDFEIEVDELDVDFYNSMKLVKKEFQKQYPEYELKGKLTSKKLVPNKIEGEKSAMLFSGGVDAYATYIRIFDQTPDLITIHGADIEINNKVQWKDFTDFIEAEELLVKNDKQYIETNVRKFYTYQVELLLKDIGWWGKIQHGLSLIGSTAPLTYINKYSALYIASSYTEQVAVAWGSTPEIDEKISWASLPIYHDGYELKRQDKVDLIAKFGHDTNTRFNLRVCYSELREDFNCSKCEKCYRTILGLVLAGQNPNNYGFVVTKDFYDGMLTTIGAGGTSKGMNYFWWELMEKAKTAQKPFIFDNADIEKQQIKIIAEGEINDRLTLKLEHNKNNKYRLKFILRNKFAPLYKLYKKLK